MSTIKERNAFLSALKQGIEEKGWIATAVSKKELDGYAATDPETDTEIRRIYINDKHVFERYLNKTRGCPR